MRARDRDVAPGVGADHGVARGVVGIGDVLSARPSTLDQAVAAAAHEHGGKAGRMLARFADLPEGSFVWTRSSDGSYRLGRITGPWRYDDSVAAHDVGIHHVRDAQWVATAYGEAEVPAAVAHTFARGGRNLQRINDEDAELRTSQLWSART